MDSSGGQSQEMSSDSLGSMLVAGPKAAGQAQAERKPRPQPEQALKCPRCESSNTKFCYYNNYSLTQPRYFCKACRRYWTKGGTLRNVPVGGGCRKNRRSSSSSASSPAQPKRAGLHEPNSHHQFSSGPLLHPSYAGTLMTNPGFSTLPALGPGGYDQNDLTLAFARLQKSSCAGQLGSFDHHHQQQQQLSIFGNDNIILGMSNNPTTTTPGSTTAASSSGFLDALRSGFLESSYYDSNIIGGGLGDHQYGGGGGDDDDDEQHQDHVSSTTSTPAVTVTTIKQELCNGDINSNSMRSSSLDHHHDHNHSSSGSRMLWGFPWQMNNNGSGSDHHGIGIGIGLGTGNMVDFDDSTTAGRESWSGFASSWHGLLNSTPLM